MLEINLINTGNIKSLKNNKMLVKGGRMITEPQAWKQSKQIVNDIELQLLLGIQTNVDTTSTEVQELYSTVSLEQLEELLTRLPRDDNYLEIPELVMIGAHDKDKNGFVKILIEELEPA